MAVITGDSTPAKLDICVSTTRYDQSFGKEFSLGESGELKKRILGRSAAGVAEVHRFASIDDYYTFRRTLDNHYAIHMGTFSDNDHGRQVTYKGSETDDIISATGTLQGGGYLQFRPFPSIVHIDYDVKEEGECKARYGEPKAFTPFSDHQELADALVSIEPALENLSMVALDSSSAQIYHGKKCIRGSGGRRIDFAIDDATQIPDFLFMLFVRSFIGGYGWSYVTSAGSILHRSLVDLALRNPAQCDFARVSLASGLESKRVVRKRSKNKDRLTFSDIKPLSSAELEQFEAMKASHRAELKGTADVVVVHRQKATANKLVEKGVTPVQAKKIARAVYQNVLSGEFEIEFKGGSSPVSIQHLLEGEGAKYDKVQCLDPLEPEYDGRRHVAIFYWNQGKNPKIVSLAHQQTSYSLQYTQDNYTAFLSSVNLESDTEDVTRKLALTDLDPLKREALIKKTAKILGLGNATKELKSAVTTYRGQSLDKGVEPVTCRSTVASTLESRMPQHLFPHVEGSGDKKRLVDHHLNLEAMLKYYQIEVQYNQISKTIEWRCPLDDKLQRETDNADEALYATLLSLSGLNRLPQRNLSTYLTSVAERYQYNPVTEHLDSLEIEPDEDIFEQIAHRMVSKDDREIGTLILRQWAIQAVAAADGAQRIQKTHPHYECVFEYMMILQSSQGKRKTKGLRRFLPEPLRQYFLQSHVLNIENKDNVLLASSNWMVELGEIESTFSKQEIEAIKGFLSKDADIIRPPYAHTTSRRRRQTVYGGSCNGEDVFRDKSGNRRFWPMRIKDLPELTDAEINTLWKTAWHLYLSGEQWWPNQMQEDLLRENVEKFEEKSPAYDVLEDHYAWQMRPTSDERKTVTAIIQDINVTDMNSGLRSGTARDSRAIGEAVRTLYTVYGIGEVIEGSLYTTIDGCKTLVNNPSGKNRGYIMPPISSFSAAQNAPHYYDNASNGG